MDLSKFKCGLKPSKHKNDDNTSYKFSIHDFENPLPDEFSLKDKMVRFIQNYNDCASVSTIHHVMALKDIKHQLSVLYQYYWARKLAGTEDVDDGTSIDKNMETIILHGYIRDEIYRYDCHNVLSQPHEEAMNEGNKNIQQFKGYRRLIQSLWNIKYVISILKEPIVFGAKIYQSFFHLDEKNCVKTPDEFEKLNDQGLVGFHALTLISYDDKKQMFEVQNSWDFGDSDGCHWMPYSYILDHSLVFDLYILEK
jgi:hypothetical protein